MGQRWAPFSSPARLIYDGTNIWVTNNGSDNVVVLRKKNGSILRTYGAGKDPFGIAFDGVNIWVANSGDNTVSSSISLL